MTAESIEMGGLLCADAARHNPGRGMRRRNNVLRLRWTGETLARRALARKARFSAGR